MEFSPILWTIEINPLLLKFTEERYRADDVAITISGRYLDTIMDFIQHARTLFTTVNWTTNVGSGVNPDKTEVVTFEHCISGSQRHSY